uniref:Uncharacterized protein n=1 Tax=Oryza barthii TaxID=65489 RepID=A0A0D3HH00_9ORYZ
MATERLLNYMPPAIMLQAEIALSELIQSSPEEALHDYILGVLAPDPPFSDEIFKERCLGSLSAHLQTLLKQTVHIFQEDLAIGKCAALSYSVITVRVFARDAAKACYMAVTSGNEKKDILTSLEERLLDFDVKAAEKPQTVVISRYCRVQNLRRCGQLTPASGKKMARE